MYPKMYSRRLHVENHKSARLPTKAIIIAHVMLFFLQANFWIPQEMHFTMFYRTKKCQMVEISEGTENISF